MATVYRVKGEDGRPLDALLEISRSSIVLRARGGTRGEGAINTDYATALRLILTRLLMDGRIRIKRAYVDSRPVQNLPIQERLIFSKVDQTLTVEQAFSRMSMAMERTGQGNSKSGKGNRTKRIRLDLDLPTWAANLEKDILKVEEQIARIPASELRKVTAEHILEALRTLQGGDQEHGFGPSTDYDIVLETGERLPPKAVFGVAASNALGYRVLPGHFTGGVDSTCFRLLKEAGFEMVPKGQPVTPIQPFESPEERRWAEGNPKLVTHLRRERAPGLAQAKKAEFKRLHGHLYCERCKVNPIEKYGSQGEACIEVHHKRVQVKDMNEGHITQLSDLECLCANCHRVEHVKLKLAQANA